MSEVYPVRVNRAAAMRLLCIGSGRVFAKVVDANPQLVHRLPGETRGRYLREEIVKLLSPAHGVRPAGKVNQSQHE